MALTKLEKDKRRTKFKIAKAMLDVGFSWQSVLNDPTVSPLTRNEIESWIQQRTLQDIKNNSCCTVRGCLARVMRQHAKQWYCWKHYIDICREAGRKGAEKRNKHRRKKEKPELRHKKLKKAQTEAERRRRIFASWKNPELDKLRITPEYQEWRIAVLERDGYKCQHCQKTGGILHAHHIKTFKMNPEIRYDVENGITLCKQCHEDLHIANVDKALKTQIKSA